MEAARFGGVFFFLACVAYVAVCMFCIRQHIELMLVWAEAHEEYQPFAWLFLFAMTLALGPLFSPRVWAACDAGRSGGRSDPGLVRRHGRFAERRTAPDS